MTWSNYGGNIVVKPKRIEQPTTLQHLIDIVRNAEAHGLTVRGFGDGHSFSSVAVTDDVMVRTHSYASPLPLPPMRNLAGNPRLVNVEAGITLAHLIKHLRSLKTPLALPNMGSYTGQALIGAITTGTHGSGLTLGPLADMVRSILIVASGGRVFRIEPVNGISDPSIPETGVTLVQNDDWFHSVVVSMGCMGLVHSLVIEGIPDYELFEDRRLGRWTEARSMIDVDHAIFSRFRHQEILVNPYSTDGAPKVLVTARRTRTTEARSPQPTRDSPWLAVANVAQQLVGIGLQSHIVNHPTQIPGVLDSGLSALRGTFCSHYDNVLTLGLGGIDGYANEIAIPFEQAATAVDIIIETLNKLRVPKNWRTYMTSPFSLRFVAASSHYLAPQYGRPTCMIELPFISLPDIGVTEESVLILNHIQRRLQTTCDARMHWGLEFDALTAEQVRTMYPRWQTWCDVLLALDPRGTFRNSWTRRVIEPLLQHTGGTITR